MSSLYSDASLVMIPSGYKTSKVYSAVPTDGTGDLVFTRSNDTATRVNSAGLIEKVRTNLNLYSEQMDNAYYTKTTGTTVTANNAANPIDGALTADTINYDGTGTSGNYRIYSSPVLTSISGYEYTWSVWLRCATPTTFILSNNRALTSVNVTSTWQRFSVTGIGNGASSIQTLIYSNSGNNSPFALEVFGQQVELGVMTDYIPTTTAAVSVGPVANVPRLDYLNSTCPRLLLEPQRTNLLTFSEQFDNAAWGKTNITISANNVTSPDGYQNADTSLSDGVNAVHIIASNIISFTSGTAYSFSVFAKKGTNNFMQLIISSTVGGMFANFDLNNGTVGTLGTLTGTTPTSSIVDYGNGWYRCVINFIPTATTSAYANFVIVTSASAARAEANTLSTSVILWGAQLEAGAYPTSYIPTLEASVTRGADACVKTGITSLIGQTEGTIYWEGSVAGTTSTIKRLASLSDGTTNNAIYVQNAANTATIQYVVVVGGSTVVNVAETSAFTFGQQFKLAAAYKANDFFLYINGVQVGTATSGSVPATSKFAFDRGNDTTAHEGTINEALLFKTRLSNADLAVLTA